MIDLYSVIYRFQSIFIFSGININYFCNQEKKLLILKLFFLIPTKKPKHIFF